VVVGDKVPGVVFPGQLQGGFNGAEVVPNVENSRGLNPR
jgi:hypothetical protein